MVKGKGKIKVVVTGAGGRMGTRLVSLIKESPNLELVGAVEGKGHPAVGVDAGETAGCGRLGVRGTDDLTALADRAEVLIEFTSPDATLKHLAIMADSRKAMVIGTTGFSAPQLGERKRGEIGMQVIRAGDIIGDHIVLFGGLGERIEVTHRVQSRDTFARGALRAAQWVVAQAPGLYDMQNVLGLK